MKRLFREDKDGRQRRSKTTTTLTNRKKGSTPAGLRIGVKTKGGK